jgi:hypothetical protein
MKRPILLRIFLHSLSMHRLLLLQAPQLLARFQVWNFVHSSFAMPLFSKVRATVSLTTGTLLDFFGYPYSMTIYHSKWAHPQTLLGASGR